MPKRKVITNNVTGELFSVETYEDPLFFTNFDPSAEFDKWAAIEVSDFGSIPDGMESLTIPAGLYAVFIHKGPAREGQRTYEYIFRAWLPNSAYQVDDRPHFAIMGEKYRSDDPASEEEIWIPIRAKAVAGS